jgi:galactokinase
VAATGVPVGLMDQLTAVLGQAGAALLLDCRTLAAEAVPLPASARVGVVHSGLPRTLAGSTYADRRAACEAAARRLGLSSLRDARPDQVRDDPIARHVVSENERVLATAEALRRGDVRAAGSLLVASHASLRDDYAVSTPELDLLVELLLEEGALGARLTGAGFGGCVVALVGAPDGAGPLERAAARYRERAGRTPQPFLVAAVDGAGPVASS